MKDKSQPESDEDEKDARHDKDHDEQPNADHCGGYVCESFHGGLLKYVAGQVSLFSFQENTKCKDWRIKSSSSWISIFRYQFILY